MVRTGLRVWGRRGVGGRLRLSASGCTRVKIFVWGRCGVGGRLRLLAVLGYLACSATCSAQDTGPTPDISAASWIWPSGAAGPDRQDACFVRKKFVLPAKPVAATITITADNGFDLYINGRYVAGESGIEASVWKTVERFRIDPYLLEGANVVAVRGENLGGPGGLIASVRIWLPDQREASFATDATWLVSTEPRNGWTEPDHDDSLWSHAVVLGKHGMAPWGNLGAPGSLSSLAPRSGRAGKFSNPAADESWPAGVVFLAGKVNLEAAVSPPAIWPIHGSRAFFEYEVPGPAALGRKLYTLVPARPGVEPRLLVDAGRGLIGPATSSFDGREIVFAMAPAGEKFFHLYHIAADGSGLVQLTTGPWHDYDPAILPDGRIVFASTRIGSRDEYHGNAARSLFTLDSDGTMQPLTQHIVADSEPRVMADGRIAFIRSDNFFERAKVETHIHAIRPDGTGGEVLLGANRSAIVYDRPSAAEHQSLWLRNYGFGCPAPLADGRVACLSYAGPIVSPRISSGRVPPATAWDKIPLRSDVALYDIAPLPDGRLLCSTTGGALATLDPDTGHAVRLYQTDTDDLHAVAYLGPRPRPPVVSPTVADDKVADPEASGYLLCQNVFDTRQTAADWRRVKAVRIVMGDALTTRSARHAYDHIGVEGVELGTVPLAPDGSFYVRVPADRALAIQAVDAEGRPVVNELSWIYVRPGERRACVGCHAPTQSAPAPADALAATREPVDLRSTELALRFRANNAANGGVLNLQFDRFREVASINLYRDRLPTGADPMPAGRSREVAWLSALVTGGKPAQQVSAAQRLAVLRDRDAAPALAIALGDSDAAVRRNAALALAACGTREVVPRLRMALADGDAAAAQAAQLAIVHLCGHEEAFNPYAAGPARQEGLDRWQQWYCALDWETLENERITHLDSGDAIRAHESIESLGHIGGERGRAALRRFVAAGGPHGLATQLAAIRALGHLRDEAAVPLLAQILDQNIAESPMPSAGSHEFGWAQQPVQLAGAAAEALGLIASPAAEERLLAAFARLTRFWYYTYRNGDHEWLMGCHASVPHFRIIEALDAMGSTKAGPLTAALLCAVPMDPDRGLLFENDTYEILTARVLHRAGTARGAIETCLAVLGDAQAQPVEALRDAVTASPPAVSVGPLSPAARAAQLLSMLCLDESDVARLRAAFERFRAAPADASRSWTCFFLARTLGKWRDRDSIAVLTAALDKDATEASLGIPDPPSVFLHQALTPLYRAAAADALGRINAGEAVPSLLRAVGNFDNAMDVRHAAARALAAIHAAPSRRISNPAGVGRVSNSAVELDQLARNYPEVTTRRVLLQAAQNARRTLSASSRP